MWNSKPIPTARKWQPKTSQIYVSSSVPHFQDSKPTVWVIPGSVHYFAFHSLQHFYFHHQLCSKVFAHGAQWLTTNERHWLNRWFHYCSQSSWTSVDCKFVGKEKKGSRTNTRAHRPQFFLQPGEENLCPPPTGSTGGAELTLRHNANNRDLEV